jgi:hypothetical protein
MHPWVPAGADGLASGFGVAGVVDPEGVEVPGVDEGFGLVAVLVAGLAVLVAGLVAVLVAEADDELAGGPDAGAEVPGDAGELGASCEQAAMITRLPAGSALPPTPLRSTK